MRLEHIIDLKSEIKLLSWKFVSFGSDLQLLVWSNTSSNYTIKYAWDTLLWAKWIPQVLPPFQNLIYIITRRIILLIILWAKWLPQVLPPFLNLIYIYFIYFCSKTRDTFLKWYELLFLNGWVLSRHNYYISRAHVSLYLE